jgi:site-specific DNA-cytosine methylase
MTAATLFSGCGGSDLGLKMAGVDVVYANDIEPQACETYALNHAGRVECKDVGLVTAADIGAVDLLVASPPCQPWSAMGSRRGSADPRNKFPDYLRLLGEVAPAATIFENVAALARDPYFRAYVLRGIRRLGYGVHAKVLNAADLGVAQDRSRLIVVGLKGRTNADAARCFPRAIAPRLGVRDVCPHVVRVVGHEYYKPLYRPASLPMPTIAAGQRPFELQRRDESCSKPTVSELLALSSFPPGFKFRPGSSYAECHTRIGNAVAPLMIFHVATAVRGLGIPFSS